jgi:hypothetical protein
MDRWNARDIEGYLEVYWKSPNLLVVIDSQQFNGWQELHDVYVHWHHVEGEPERLGCGAIRVRTHRFFEKVGYECVLLEGIPLPVFQQTSMMGASAILMHLKTCSMNALQLAERYHDSWTNRIVIE